MQDQIDSRRGPGTAEFVALMAFLSALDALSTDSMLPARGAIGAELGASGTAPQHVVSTFFLGMAAGQLVCGPLSDSYGRKRTIYAFLALYLAGTVVAILAPGFGTMLAGRLLQGFGAAGPFVVTLAIIRDCYKGEAMARISSFVMSVFILVPIVAPLIGQGVLLIFDWRAIFVMLLAFALAVLVWFALRQPETLAPERCSPFTPALIWQALAATCGNAQALGYTVIEGFVFAALLGYLSSAQQVFQDLYGQGVRFPLYFGMLGFGVGAAALLNASLVLRLGMRRLTAIALAALGIGSLAFLVWAVEHGGRPPFWSLMAYLAPALFCFGLLFGNLSALALEPLGEKAGMGATVFGAISTFIALPLGTLVGQSFDMTVIPLAAGFALLPLMALTVMALVERKA